jgi:sugar-specific transcriptional regulator TrmB
MWKFVKRDKGFNRQLVMIEDVLSRFGLLKNEIRVYIYLARSGEKRASEIAEAISLHRTETYRILRDLEKRGIVFSAFEKPLKFTAVPLGKTIDLLIEAQKMKIKLLEKEKVGVMQLWLSIPQEKTEENKKDIFQILEGGQQTILKANELLGRTKTGLQIFAPAEYLAQLYHSDFTDNLSRCASKIEISLLTENSLKSKFIIDQMRWIDHKYKIIDVNNVPCFMICDGKELLMIMQRENDGQGKLDRKKSKTVALWTNYSAFVETMSILFSKLDETGKAPQQICVKRTQMTGS